MVLRLALFIVGCGMFLSSTMLAATAATSANLTAPLCQVLVAKKSNWVVKALRWGGLQVGYDFGLPQYISKRRVPEALVADITSHSLPTRDNDVRKVELISQGQTVSFTVDLLDAEGAIVAAVHSLIAAAPVSLPEARAANLRYGQSVASERRHYTENVLHTFRVLRSDPLGSFGVLFQSGTLLSLWKFDDKTGGPNIKAKLMGKLVNEGKQVEFLVSLEPHSPIERGQLLRHLEEKLSKSYRGAPHSVTVVGHPQRPRESFGERLGIWLKQMGQPQLQTASFLERLEAQLRLLSHKQVVAQWWQKHVADNLKTDHAYLSYLNASIGGAQSRRWPEAGALDPNIETRSFIPFDSLTDLATYLASTPGSASIKAEAVAAFESAYETLQDSLAAEVIPIELVAPFLLRLNDKVGILIQGKWWTTAGLAGQIEREGEIVVRRSKGKPEELGLPDYVVARVFALEGGVTQSQIRGVARSLRESLEIE